MTRKTKSVSLISVASGRNIIGEIAASAAATSPTAFPAIRRPRSPTSTTVPLPITAMPSRCASTLRMPRPGEEREDERVDRRVLGGRDDEVELHEVERPDVAAPVGQVVREQVVGARVAERRDVRIDEHDDEHPHDQRDDGDPSSADRERAVGTRGLPAPSWV